MELSSPLGTTRCIPQEKFPKSHIINPLLTKLVRSRWLDIGQVLLLRVYGLRCSVHKHGKRELEQHPAIFISHLVNSPYMSFNCYFVPSISRASRSPRFTKRVLLIHSSQVVHFLFSCVHLNNEIRARDQDLEWCNFNEPFPF